MFVNPCLHLLAAIPRLIVLNCFPFLFKSVGRLDVHCHVRDNSTNQDAHHAPQKSHCRFAWKLEVIGNLRSHSSSGRLGQKDPQHWRALVAPGLIVARLMNHKTCSVEMMTCSTTYFATLDLRRYANRLLSKRKDFSWRPP